MTISLPQCYAQPNDSFFYQDDNDGDINAIAQDNRLHCNSRALWDRHIKVPPQRALAVLSRGLPPTQISLIFNSYDSPSAKIIISGDGQFSDRRPLNFYERRAAAGNVKITEGKNGTGRILARNQMNFLYRIGLQGMDIAPGSTAGGYFWARMGANLDTDMKKTDFLARDIHLRFKAIKPFLSRADQREMERALRLRHPTDIWAVADSRTPVQDILSDLAYSRTARTTLPEKLKTAFNELALQIRYSPVSIHENLHHARELASDSLVTLGQYMLLKGRWSGRLDFDNAAQMQRVSNYVGGLDFV